MRGRAYAMLNLAVRFAGQMLWRVPLRALRRGRELGRFLAHVRPDGYAPMRPDDRARFADAMGCVHCGLCTLACPALAEAPAGVTAEPWTFVGGPSRALDRAIDIVADLEPCTRCEACAAVCPTGVPIPHLAAMVQRMAHDAARPTPREAVAAGR